MQSTDVFVQKFKESLDIKDKDDITLETTLEEMEWDSLATLSVLVLMQEVFGKMVEGKKVRQCITVGDIYRLGKESA